MVICVIGPPSAGKTTFIKKYGKNFQQIISDEIYKKEKNWNKVNRIVREMILLSSSDIIIEIAPNGIKDLIDYIIEIKPPIEPRRNLDEEEEFIFYEWRSPGSVKNKLRLITKDLKWEALNKRFSRLQRSPLCKWK